MDACQNCSEPLKEPRKLKDFCSYACRGKAAVDALPQTALIGSKNTRRNRALQTLKRASTGEPIFSKINSVTYRINRPHKADAVGWLMEVNWPGGKSSERWVACVKNHRSEPLPLELAKRAAVDFLAIKSGGEPRELIAELNDYHAEAVKDAEPLLNISDEPPPTEDDWRYIVQTECGPTRGGDDYQLTYDANGYPELPACLDRRARCPSRGGIKRPDAL